MAVVHAMSQAGNASRIKANGSENDKKNSVIARLESYSRNSSVQRMTTDWEKGSDTKAAITKPIDNMQAEQMFAKKIALIWIFKHPENFDLFLNDG